MLQSTTLDKERLCEVHCLESMLATFDLIYVVHVECVKQYITAKSVKGTGMVHIN